MKIEKNKTYIATWHNNVSGDKIMEFFVHCISDKYVTIIEEADEYTRIEKVYSYADLDNCFSDIQENNTHQIDKQN